MKGYKIDSINRQVTEVELSSDYRDIYNVVNCETFACPYITAENDALYCDDEGLLKPVEGFFLLEGYSQPIAGNGLILGTDDEGDSADARVDLETLKSRVKFMTHSQAYQHALNSYQ